MRGWGENSIIEAPKRPPATLGKVEEVLEGSGHPTSTLGCGTGCRDTNCLIKKKKLNFVSQILKFRCLWNIIQTVKHWCRCIMVWGCFSSSGTGALIKINGKNFQIPKDSGIKPSNSKSHCTKGVALRGTANHNDHMSLGGGLKWRTQFNPLCTSRLKWH